MRLHACPACAATLFFHNFRCEACGAAVSYDPETDAMAPREAAPLCANADSIDCNWREAPGGGPLCRSCAMTAVHPDPAVGDNLLLWAEAERAKRWVLANLARWGWFSPADPGPPPAFRMLAEETAAGDVAVTMGHAGGVVTINVEEADPAIREARRAALGERYRTMTGHMRHELAHVLFDRLAADPAFPEDFRALFGDERADYAAALERHYADGPPPDWAGRFVTRYASAHPHEDWAESVAHLLHMVDLVDSAAAAGLAPGVLDPYALTDAEHAIALGVEYGIALNHVSRSMGFADIYPFVLAPLPREKLVFVHHALRAGPRPGTTETGNGKQENGL